MQGLESQGKMFIITEEWKPTEREEGSPSEDNRVF